MQPTSPKSKIECSQFAEFFGLFPLLGRFAFNIFKKWICPISLALIGLFGKKTKQTLRLDCRFVIWSKESGQFLPNIISQKYDLAFPNRIEQVHSPQNDDKTTQVCGESVNEKWKNVKRVSPPNGNRPGVFKQGTSDISRTCSLVKTTRWSSQNWLFFWFCLLSDRESLVKP